MQKSFFTRLKDKLNTGDDQGRYVEVIIQEVFIEYPRLISTIFPKIKFSSKDDIEITIETYFIKKRRADLCIWINGKITGLLEIKYNDKALDGQLEDYISFCKKNKLHFSYLTINSLSGDEKRIIESASEINNNINHILYNQIYRNIIKNKYESHPVVNLFCKFLEENFMIYDPQFINDNDDVLEFIMLKTLFVKHAHGFGRKKSENRINAIPQYWNAIINVMQIIGDRLHNEHDNFFNVKPSIDYCFQPEFNLKKIINELEDEDNKISTIGRDDRTGGEFSIWFSGKIKPNSSAGWIYLSCGFSFQLDLEEKKINKYLYATVHCDRLDSGEKYQKISKIPADEDRCYLTFINALILAIDNILRNKSNSTELTKNKRLVKKLNSIKIELKNRHNL